MPIATGEARRVARCGTWHDRKRTVTARLAGGDASTRLSLKHGGMHVAAKRRPSQISNQSKAETSSPPTGPRAADRPVRTPADCGRDRSTQARFEDTTGLRRSAAIRNTY